MTPPEPVDSEKLSKPVLKRYKPPRLRIYGDLAEITKGQLSGGQNDGSGHPNKHFTS
jgi:hypothetical protein